MKIKKIFIVMISLIMTFSLVACNDNKTKNDTVIDKKGTYDTEETVKNIKITADEVILSNKVIEGDLQIDVPGLSGDLTLDNVTVNGKIIVNDPQQEYIIRMYDVKAAAMEVNNESNLLKLLASKGTSIPSLSAKGSISLTEQALVGNGFHDVVVSGKSALISLLGAGINQLTVNDSENSTVNIDPETLVMNLVANGPLKIAGKGIVEKLIAKANVDFETEPKNMEIQDGVLVNGTEHGITTPATTTTTAKATSATTTKKTTAKPVTTTKPATTVTTTTPVVTSPVNTAPIITAADVIIKTGETFNPLAGVTIYDKEDGGYITVLTSHIQSNTVDLSKTGTYTVVYAYTDKGGLKTTYSRKVTVEQGNKLSKVENFKATLNSSGDILLSWDSVSNVSYYEVYFNGRFYEEVLRTRNTLIVPAADLAYGKDVTFGLVAASNDTKINKSDTATYEFVYEKDSISFPSSVNASDSNAVTLKYKKSPVGLDQSNVYADITVYLDDVVVRGMNVYGNYKTDSKGKVSIPYNVDKGLQLSVLFDEAGYYTFEIELTSKYGVLANDTFDIRVNSSSSGSTGKIAFNQLELITDGNWRSGVDVTFSVNNTVDLKTKNYSIELIVDWESYDGTQGGVFVFTDRQIVSDYILSRNKDIVITIAAGSKEGNKILNVLQNDDVTMFAEISIYDDSNREIAFLKSRSLRIKKQK